MQVFPLPTQADTVGARCRLYRNVLASFLEALADGRAALHLPKMDGLRRPGPGMFFHLNPELFLQVGGAVRFECPGGGFTLRAGEIALMPRGVPHAEKVVGPRAGGFRGFVICLFSTSAQVICSDGRPGGPPSVGWADSFEANGFGQAARYIDDAAALAPLHGRTVRRQRAALAQAAIGAIDLAIGRAGSRPGGEIHPTAASARAIVESEISDPGLDVRGLAGRLGCSPDHLTRLFRKETGMTVREYVGEQRLARARVLLQDPQLNVSEVGWACGFSSPNYFVRAFRKATGRTPGEFRKVT